MHELAPVLEDPMVSTIGGAPRVNGGSWPRLGWPAKFGDRPPEWLVLGPVGINTTLVSGSMCTV